MKRKGVGTKRSNLPGKLFDCRSTNPDECELFIVEGESAGGTAVSGRDSRTQAVLPLRGKILNTEVARDRRRFCRTRRSRTSSRRSAPAIGPNFDAHRLRYHRIILLMDADSDGYHISTLLLTFFFRHMRELIQQGKVYLGQPPLYKIEVGKQRFYARDDAARRRSSRRSSASR